MVQGGLPAAEGLPWDGCGEKPVLLLSDAAFGDDDLGTGCLEEDAATGRPEGPVLTLTSRALWGRGIYLPSLGRKKRGDAGVCLPL